MGSSISGTHTTALLETVPGIASVLRSPVADALVNTIRAAAGVAEFRMEDVRELVQYATRRGLIGFDEGDRLVAEMERAFASRRPRVAAPKAAAKPARAAHKPAKPRKKAGKKRR
jgi:hypothetical protein